MLCWNGTVADAAPKDPYVRGVTASPAGPGSIESDFRGPSISMARDLSPSRGRHGVSAAVTYAESIHDLAPNWSHGVAMIELDTTKKGVPTEGILVQAFPGGAGPARLPTEGPSEPRSVLQCFDRESP